MKIGNKKISVTQLIRLLVQITFFIFIPALFIQALNGVKQIYLAIVGQTFSSALLPQMVELIALIPLTIILGRFFCGWMCGFGSFTDFIYLISGKLFKRKFKVNQKMNAVLKYVKYALLAVLVVFAWSLNMTIFNSLSPWDVFGMTAIVGTVPDLNFVISNLLIAFIFFILIIIASVFVERFFCRYLCPMGAVFAITSKLRIGKIKKPTDKCGKCRICTNNCLMGIPLYEMEVVNSAECINCMKCISVCPRHNVSYTVAKKDVQPLIVSAVAVAVMTGTYYTTYSAMGLSGSNVSAAEQSQTTVVNQIYQDGTYEGSGTGFRGTTKVSVTIENDKITKITTVSYRDDKQYYDRAFSTVTKKIVSSQSTTVDSVSGATYSSKGIMAAVENALSQAKAALTASTQATSSAMLAQNTDAATTATDSATTATGTGTTTAGTTSAATGTTAATTATTATTAATAATTAPTTAAVATGQYKDGTYTGSGTGFKGGTGATKVSVVVAGGKITSVTTVSYKDDQQYYNRAFSTISKNIVSNQTASVDTVSGATYSSKGIIQAVAAALSTATN
ncbi:FMN-binding protein [[Clostridium] fimetarium]|uniref:FMN-binding domain-containing protein n=1 Tax=[Clostridium] fimetarium TaxID=99656 RepID=A0A1I0NSR3_9FIRM|nr:FMN-binding protein [[Clostridium] fimetarium]SEW04629.1 FMN-binding domain-containing protein [[Clostridium] fimetarium]